MIILIEFDAGAASNVIEILLSFVIVYSSHILLLLANAIPETIISWVPKLCVIVNVFVEPFPIVVVYLLTEGLKVIDENKKSGS